MVVTLKIGEVEIEVGMVVGEEVGVVGIGVSVGMSLNSIVGKAYDVCEDELSFLDGFSMFPATFSDVVS
jgi:hypothetical protein